MDPITSLLGSLPPDFYITDPDVVAKYLTDFRHFRTGASRAVLRPRTTAEVQRIVAACAAHGVPLVPQGGNTSYCAAATPSPLGGELVLSLERLNAVRAIDPTNLSLTAEAGCVLSVLQEAADAAGLMLPLDLGSRQSCQLGGALSTNAGGISVLKYGMARDLVLGLEAVLPDGQLLNVLQPLRKNNTGYDVKQVLLGAEGTLGIVTAASLKLARKPAQTVTAFLAVAEIDALTTLLARAQLLTGENVTSFEYISHHSLGLLLAAQAGLRHPLEAPARHYVVMEAQTCSPLLGLEEAMAAFLEEALGEGLVNDGTIAAGGQQRDQLWYLREHIPEAEVANGGSVKHDVSVPTSALPSFISQASALVETHGAGGRLSIYGHVGDGNVHFNVVAPAGADPAGYKPWFEREVSPRVYDLAVTMGGSFGAEYGIGIVKLDLLERYGDPAKLHMMRALKAALDPANLMNPGKVVRA
ncbi:FAD/FMN-containing dehydrogenase [Ancylobacter aquaticus]|uniref:FAD/FMN-containing dehydrogenase n=1 Tax=Ancylobacter aquaticus TaxID=100 RepID=A0A4R1I319_ANCAQ|nr:FAD-binding oxidoreductase [Ancylobacter aquaticus]TCK28371.1 FAD/FMN-containing dehydrogenase [Ancylobacter aquaticus]